MLNEGFLWFLIKLSLLIILFVYLLLRLLLILLLLFNRLSRLMGQKLTDNNPNITDLGDKIRPTKLAERYSELYDNQWTDAIEMISDEDEREKISILKQILKVNKV